ncbi:hypothetical protein C6361_12155 [Plantactinospora sp. BC1]|uniref:toll/interleukin-1 receptor domain-containing protein n=1 Tax=Plantactinospora sp. BC1 TaxID=2108470 RepID=UPI000D15C10D|nr:toll/interleukin-1 receptor domain-containing protein [Plantactinospora sp. BC1]AVT30124.1 hypothetical protein C6361_12155 [Plantactinospora sp. BC1]
MAHDLFLSYSRKNKRFIDRLAADLREHHVDVWLDTIEIEVGDLIHLTIEQGIEQSRYFCLALSPASLRSYYVRGIEFETAFARMVRERRESFILPILIQRVDEPLPARLAGRAYLDFTNKKLYAENVRKLARKVQLQSDLFSGQRWYKALEISPFGEIVGIGEITQVAPTGPSICITWTRGTVSRADIYYNAANVHYKQFSFDEHGRVVQNMMYELDGAGGWRYVDTWRYEYDPATGRRVKKFVEKTGARSYRVLDYDGHNNVLEERVVTLEGAPDLSYGYTRKLFEYSEDGHVLREILYDQEGDVVRTVERKTD